MKKYYSRSRLMAIELRSIGNLIGGKKPIHKQCEVKTKKNATVRRSRVSGQLLTK